MVNSLEEVLQENSDLAAKLFKAENALMRESIAAVTNYVDPLEALRGTDGELWAQLDYGINGKQSGKMPFSDEQQLATARATGRMLERCNEFAINGHENRISYIVGPGHTYKVVGRKCSGAASDLVDRVQEIVDEFVYENRWQQRQQEIVRRRDRDGEVFLRLFAAPDGTTQVRFVEPEQVFRPQKFSANPAASFGIETEPDDVETVLGYWIDGQLIDAADIQHRKQGVDRNVKRGIPLFWPVRQNLLRAEKLLRNMATVADIQTAIAMIRRHDRATGSAAQAFRNGNAHASVTASQSGGTTYYKHYAPGTILDVPKGIDYDFPASGLDASRYVHVLQAILRSVAARLVFPEFMLTSDASNANYASTLVAEGPAVKMFQRWQADMAVDDLEVIWKVVEYAIRAGKVPRDALDVLEIQVGKPRVDTRNEEAEARINERYYRLGIKSKQTIAAELGLSYDQEQENLRACNEASKKFEKAKEN